ncbi:MAG: phosphoribosylformylglycinamidine synthase subunit PurS [Candidatus Omnitrophica bacterium]|nr:phosphoribosylformylglycinamidine synthase subunit PurS [Candidatus Omnitrophota bacterium]MDD5672348.1 phosphoribosylformylglycinamidine synthase subunit PurS [Candidatus Omnitrophota bacterium]
MYKATVNVTLKKSVLDPQGKTVLHALETLGFQGVKDVRVGKYFELAIDEEKREKAEEQVRAMCDKLLINPVIEDYSFKLNEA